MFHVENVITHYKCKNIMNGLFCTFFNQVWYNFVGFIIKNNKCFHNSKKSN